MSTSRDPKDLMARMDALWQEAWPAFTRLSDDEMSVPAADGESSAKDIAAHFARWEDWHREAIGEHLADGSIRSYAGYNSWNEDWAAQDKSLTSPEARNRLESSHAQLISVLNGLDARQWDDQVYDFAEQCTLNHFPEHLDQVSAVRRETS